MDGSPKATLAVLGGGRQAGDLLSPSPDGPGRPHLPPTELQASFHNHQPSLVEPPEALGPPGGQAFLSFGPGPMGGGLPPGEDPGALLANSHGAPQAPSTQGTAAAADNDGFLPHGFLTGTPGHGGHHSPVLPGQSLALPGQPPLPEKKRASEGDRSAGSASPSSSGFSSPHSGSTMSIPFPNVLPDFPKALEAAAPSPGRRLSRRGVVGSKGGLVFLGSAARAKPRAVPVRWHPPLCAFRCPCPVLTSLLPRPGFPQG